MTESGAAPSTWGAVIEAFENAGLDAREAYWAYPHRPSHGDMPLVVVVGGIEHVVQSVAVEGDRIIVRAAATDQREGRTNG